jgi:hypothetical protein
MAERTFTLTQQQYEALIEFARRGTRDDDGVVDLEESRKLDEFLKFIEAANDITRDGVWIRWQELNQPLPPGTNFPNEWPPTQQYWLEFIGRRVSRADVDAAVENQATTPYNVMVTKDPGARVGWTPVDDFFVR